jgi:hypothetical protein
MNATHVRLNMKADKVTGETNHLLQDCSKGLGSWLANRLDARQAIREAAQMIQEEPLVNLDAAAKVLAEKLDYPWDYMPQQGKDKMREIAKAVVKAALKPT